MLEDNADGTFTLKGKYGKDNTYKVLPPVIVLQPSVPKIQEQNLTPTEDLPVPVPGDADVMWKYVQDFMVVHTDAKSRPNIGHVPELLKLPRLRNLEWNPRKTLAYKDSHPRDVAALLMQVTGRPATEACTKCREGGGLFKGCITIPPAADLSVQQRVYSCANCLYHCGQSRCSIGPLLQKEAQERHPELKFDRALCGSLKTTTPRDGNNQANTPAGRGAKSLTPATPVEAAAADSISSHKRKRVSTVPFDEAGYRASGSIRALTGRFMKVRKSEGGRAAAAAAIATTTTTSANDDCISSKQNQQSTEDVNMRADDDAAADDGEDASQQKDGDTTGAATDFVTPGGRYLRPRTMRSAGGPNDSSPATPLRMRTRASSNVGGNVHANGNGNVHVNGSGNAAADVAAATALAAVGAAGATTKPSNNRHQHRAMRGGHHGRGGRPRGTSIGGRERTINAGANGASAHKPAAMGMVPVRDMIKMAPEILSMEDWEVSGLVHSKGDVDDSEFFFFFFLFRNLPHGQMSWDSPL